MKLLLLVVTVILLQTPYSYADDNRGESFKSSEQITKDLTVTGTRGISVKPHSTPTATDYNDVTYTQGQNSSGDQTSEGRVDLYIQFEYAKSNLTEQSQRQLKELAVAMNDIRLADDVFLVAGHTDAVGSDNYNMELSEKRARSVVMYLSKELGIPSDRLISRGFGERLLKDKLSPGSGVNRRVEVVNTKAFQ